MPKIGNVKIESAKKFDIFQDTVAHLTFQFCIASSTFLSSKQSYFTLGSLTKFMFILIL